MNRFNAVFVGYNAFLCGVFATLMVIEIATGKSWWTSALGVVVCLYLTNKCYRDIKD